MRLALTVLDHKQPVTPLKTDNSMIKGFVNSGMKQKSSKTWDMKWHWLIDKGLIEKLRVYWYRGTNNDVGYFIKHDPPIYQRKI